MKIHVLILLAVLIMGELSEIDYQTVKVGDYIKQYAIVQKVNPSGSYVNALCTDCTCKLTIRGSNNVAVVSNQPMSQIDTGMFGLLVTPNMLQSSQSYLTFANCTSVAYGWGIAIGQLEQKDTVSASVSLSADNATTPTDESSCGANIGCWLDRLRTPLDAIAIALNPANFANILINKFTDWLGGLSKGEQNQATGIFSSIVHSLNTIGWSFIKLITNPIGWFKEDFMPLLWAVINGGLIIMFIPIVLIEAFLMGHSLLSVQSLRDRQRLFTFITTYINDHIIIVKTALMAAAYFIGGFTWLIKVLFEGFRALRSLIPFGGA